MGTGRTIAEIVGLAGVETVQESHLCGLCFNPDGDGDSQSVLRGLWPSLFGRSSRLLEPVQVMTFGQLVEVGVMFMLPVLDPKRRMKLLMAIGLAGYAVRGVAMWYGWVPGVILLGVSMHGWSYAFFGIVGTSYLDREAPLHSAGERARVSSPLPAAASAFGSAT